jgi:polyphosphate glucokinase
MSAANVSAQWIGFPAERLFADSLDREIHFINDADAAGFAEARLGAARNVAGLVIVVTLGTGIGTALISDGVLVPNAELGHLQIDGADAERGASNAAREREGLSFEEWGGRLTRYFSHLEMLFSPDLFVIGGGVSTEHEEFFPHIHINTPIKPAELFNNAGIVGSAVLATLNH